jgi:hypothetical protein
VRLYGSEDNSDPPFLWKVNRSNEANVVCQKAATDVKLKMYKCETKKEREREKATCQLIQAATIFIIVP